jgi:hypothetical protein
MPREPPRHYGSAQDLVRAMMPKDAAYFRRHSHGFQPLASGIELSTHKNRTGQDSREAYHPPSSGLP